MFGRHKHADFANARTAQTSEPRRQWRRGLRDNRTDNRTDNRDSATSTRTARTL